MQKNSFVDSITESTDSIKPSLSDSALQSIASVNLSFGPATTKSQANLEAIFMRIESGETSYEPEENVLLEQWHELHHK